MQATIQKRRAKPGAQEDTAQAQKSRGKKKGPGGLLNKGPNRGKGQGGGGGKGLPAGAIAIPNHALVYLNVPKSACTTIKNQLYFIEHGRYIDEPLDIHSHDGLLRSRDTASETLDVFEDKLRKKHMVFTFVRHPGRRAYSCFSEKIAHTSKYSFPKVRDYIIEHYGLELPEGGATEYDRERHRANFLRFLDFVSDNFANKTDVRIDAHWGRQSSILQHFQRHFIIDFIGRVENFQRHFDFVLNQVPLLHTPDLGTHFNEGPKPPFTYEDIVDDEVERRLRNIYSDDYSLLGYTS